MIKGHVKTRKAVCGGYAMAFEIGGVALESCKVGEAHVVCSDC
jgi:hypothetical protein